MKTIFKLKDKINYRILEDLVLFVLKHKMTWTSPEVQWLRRHASSAGQDPTCLKWCDRKEKKKYNDLKSG